MLELQIKPGSTDTPLRSAKEILNSIKLEQVTSTSLEDTIWLHKATPLSFKDFFPKVNNKKELSRGAGGACVVGQNFFQPRIEFFFAYP